MSELNNWHRSFEHPRGHRIRPHTPPASYASSSSVGGGWSFSSPTLLAAWHRSDDHPRSYNIQATSSPSSSIRSRSSTLELLSPRSATKPLDRGDNERDGHDETDTTTELKKLITTLGAQLDSLSKSHRPLVIESPTRSPRKVAVGKEEARFQSAISNLAQSLLTHHQSILTPLLVSPTTARAQLRFAVEHLVDLGSEMAELDPSPPQRARDVLNDCFRIRTVPARQSSNPSEDRIADLERANTMMLSQMSIMEERMRSLVQGVEKRCEERVNAAEKKWEDLAMKHRQLQERCSALERHVEATDVHLADLDAVTDFF